MKLKIGFLFLVLFLFSAVSVSADYDITSRYCKTEFNSTKWIQTQKDVVLNVSLDMVHLEQSIFLHVYVDFTDWVEVDVTNRLSQTSSRSYFTAIDRETDDTYLYDTRIGEFQDFECTLEMYISSLASDTAKARVNLIMISGTLDSYTDILNANLPCFGLGIRSISSTKAYHLLLLETRLGTQYKNGGEVNNLNINTKYYVYMKKSGTTLTAKVDNNVDFSSPIETFSLILHANLNLQYMMCPQSVHYPTSLLTTGYAENLNLSDTQGGYPNLGILYTKDLLVNTTEKSIMIGINGIVPTNTRVRLYTSNDNSTWLLQIDNNGLGELSQYSEILYNYSSLYARIDLTTVDPLVTPFVDELFYFHTYECAVSGETKPYVFITLFTIIGIILGYAIDRA